MDLNEFKSTMLKEDEEIFEGEFEDDDEDELSSQMSIPEDNIDYSLVYALHTFLATVEGQASVVRGDSLVLLDDSNAYWWLIRVLKTQELGYIPAENIETPDERLARLNKHRNIDITSANHSDLSHQPPSSDTHAPLKIKKQKNNDGKASRNVAFTAPSYRELVLYPEEIAQAEQEAAQRALEEQDSYDEESDSGSELSSHDASLSSQSHSESSHGHLVDEQHPADSESDIIAPAAAAINSSDPPVDASQRHSYGSSADTHSSESLVQYMPEVKKHEDNTTTNSGIDKDAQNSTDINEIASKTADETVPIPDQTVESAQPAQATQPTQAAQPDIEGSTQAPYKPLQADIRPLSFNSTTSSVYSSNSNKNITIQPPQLIQSQPSDSSHTQSTPNVSVQNEHNDDDQNTTYLTTNASPLLDPATSPTRKVTITPDVAQSPDPNLLMNGLSSPTQQIAQNYNHKTSFDDLMTMDSQSSEGGGSQKTSIWKSSPLMSDRGKDKKQSKEDKKKAKKLQKERSSQSLNEMASNDSIKKKGGVFGNLFKKKEKKSVDSTGDGVDSIKSSDSFAGSDNLSDSLHKSSSQDHLNGRTSVESRNISSPMAVRHSPNTFTPLAPISHPSPSIRPRNESLANSSSLNDMKPSTSNNSLTVSPNASKGLETPSPALSQQSWTSPNNSLNARPGSLLGVKHLNVLRMFAAPSLKAEATFKTVLLNGSTTANELVKQAMQRFRLSASEEESDYFITIKEQDSGNETVIEPSQKPLALFEITNHALASKHLSAPNSDLPKVKRSSVGSISSISSNLSALPAISKLGLGDYSDDSAVKMYIHCRKTSSVDLHDNDVDGDAEDVYAGYMNDPSVSSPIFDDFEASKEDQVNHEINARNNASLSAKKKRESHILSQLHLESDKINLSVLINGKDAPEGVTLDKSMKSTNGFYENRLTIPTNSTVAEVIEQALSGFGIYEGVVDGGDDVDLRVDGRKSAVKYRLAVKPLNKKTVDAHSSLNPNSRVIDANKENIQLYSGSEASESQAQRLSYRGHPDNELQFTLIKADKLSHQNEGANMVKAAVDDSTDAPSLAEIIARQRSEKQRSKGAISPIPYDVADADRGIESTDQHEQHEKIDDTVQTPRAEYANQVFSPAPSSSSHSQSTPQQTEETPIQAPRSLDDHESSVHSEHTVGEEGAVSHKRSTSNTSEQVEELADEKETKGLGLRDSDSMENYQIGDFMHSPNTTATNSVADRSSQASSMMTSSTNDRITSGEGFDDLIERIWQRENQDDSNGSDDKGHHKDLIRSHSSFSLRTAHTDISSSTISTMNGQEFADARSTPLSRRSMSNSSFSDDDEKAIRDLQSAPVNLEGTNSSTDSHETNNKNKSNETSTSKEIKMNDSRRSVDSSHNRSSIAKNNMTFGETTKEKPESGAPVQTNRGSVDSSDSRSSIAKNSIMSIGESTKESAKTIPPTQVNRRSVDSSDSRSSISKNNIMSTGESTKENTESVPPVQMNRGSVDSSDSRSSISKSNILNLGESAKENTETVPQIQMRRQSASTASSNSESGRRSNTPSTIATTNPTPPSILFHGNNAITNGAASTDESHENTYENMRTVASSASSRSSISTPNQSTPATGGAVNTTNRLTHVENMVQSINIKHLLTLSQHARRQQAPKTPRKGDYIDQTWFAKSNHDPIYDSVRNDLDGIEGELDRLLQQTLAM
ncbi:hypothetical protein E3Q23_03360 [Wallemia mellicola]|nr:hypothetical protein E3Q23_03360 [Wallemia mellicola]TIC05946.1 hypothetical protein E3Q16_01665 [Wallemia mellicola]TIC59630.1 hypothetical protein E3Q05_00160 [Wallemia mellicola]